MLELFRLTGQPEYHAVFSQTLAFVEKHQVARAGQRRATRFADGSPRGEQRSSPWQGAYHNGRAMLLFASLLDELARKAPPLPRPRWGLTAGEGDPGGSVGHSPFWASASFL